MRLLQYLGGFTVGVIVAFFVTMGVNLLLLPPGPGDVRASRAMGMLFCIFPVMAFAFGAIGLFVVARAGSDSSTRGKDWQGR
jgi:hypothetical protein